MEALVFPRRLRRLRVAGARAPAPLRARGSALRRPRLPRAAVVRGLAGLTRPDPSAARAARRVGIPRAAAGPDEFHAARPRAALRRGGGANHRRDLRLDP